MASLRWSTRKWLAVLSVAAAVTGSVVACSAFGEDDPRAAPDGDGGGGGGETGAETSNEAAAGDSATATANDLCRTKVFRAPEHVPYTQTLESFRLDRSGTAWVSATPSGHKAMASTDFTAASGPGTLKFLLESGSSNAEQGMLTPDLLALVFQSDRASFLDAATVSKKLYVSTRASTAGSFTVAEYVKVDGKTEMDPTSVQDPYVVGMHLYYVSELPPAAKRLVLGDIDVQARIVSNVNDIYAPNGADHPVVSTDERQLFYALDANGTTIIHVATRASTGDPFPAGSPVAELRGTEDAKPAWLSADGCDLYYFTKIDTNEGLFRTTRR
jgi:hypothetical protein